MSYIQTRSNEWLISEITGCNYEKRHPGRTCSACNLSKSELIKRGIDMTISTRYGYDSGANTLTNKIEKYVVLTTGGSYRGSWADEKNALSYIKQELKNKNNTNRYMILEAVKEVGVKSPEIEIEEIK